MLSSAQSSLLLPAFYDKPQRMITGQNSLLLLNLLLGSLLTVSEGFSPAPGASLVQRGRVRYHKGILLLSALAGNQKSPPADPWGAFLLTFGNEVSGLYALFAVLLADFVYYIAWKWLALVVAGQGAVQLVVAEAGELADANTSK